MRTPENGKAMSAPPGTPLDTAHVADSTASEIDRITIVSSLKKPNGQHIRLTKMIMADGSVLGYEDAFAVKTQYRKVSSIEDVARVLAELQGRPNKAVIRGQFVGRENVLPEHNQYRDGKSLREGTYRRKAPNFPDKPHHWVMLDIDDYYECSHDPVLEPEAAALEFIRKELPSCFHDVSFVWQLSASAGTRGKERCLKVHLWFWLSKRWDSSSLEIWAKAINHAKNRTLIDTAIYQAVQLHYCAAPVLDEGVENPVPVRLGMWESADGREEVALELTPEMLLDAEKVRNSACQQDLADQSTKSGHVGLFYRAFPYWEDVVFGILEGHFEEGSADGRLTWLGSDSGQADGAWIAGPHQNHIGANHNSWPWGANRVVTLFDCVRELKFNEDGKDEVLPEDEFECLGLENRKDFEKPSYKAMCKWMDEQPEVKAVLKAEALERIDAQNDFGGEDGATSGTAEEPEAESNQEEAAIPSEGMTLKTMTLSQLMAMPQPRWLVKNLLARDSLALVYGQSSVGKTFAVIDIALAVARGTGEWFGRNAKKGGVFYIAGEGARGLVNRMKAYCQHHEVDPDEVNAAFYAGALNLLDADSVEAALDTVRKLKPALVIIDTLATTMIGGDESSAKDMTLYLDAAKKLRRASHACVLIVHHSGKDESRGARGSSSLRAAVDTEISITQTGDVRAMKITKQRDGIAGVEIGYRLHVVELGIDEEDLETITSCVVVPAEVLPGKALKPLGTIQSLVMDAIGTDLTIAKEKLYESVIPKMATKEGKTNRCRDRVNQALKSLEASGHIEVSAEGLVTVLF